MSCFSVLHSVRYPRQGRVFSGVLLLPNARNVRGCLHSDSSRVFSACFCYNTCFQAFIRNILWAALDSTACCCTVFFFLFVFSSTTSRFAYVRAYRSTVRTCGGRRSAWRTQSPVRCIHPTGHFSPAVFVSNDACFFGIRVLVLACGCSTHFGAAAVHFHSLACLFLLPALPRSPFHSFAQSAPPSIA